jgi:hypothetical protein
VGTGPIPFIRFIPGQNLLGQIQKNNNSHYPFEFIAKSPAEVLSDGGPSVDLDCYDLFSPSTGAAATPTAIPGGSALGILQAGQRCSITIESRLRETDTIGLNEYDEFWNGIGSPPLEIEWNRKINYVETRQSWDQLYESSETLIDIVYYDGDGSPDPENGYIPQIEGYGDLKEIGLPAQGPLQISSRAINPAKLVANNPAPRGSAILQRPAFDLPSIPVDRWGNPVDAFSLPFLTMHMNQEDGVAEFRATSSIRSLNHITGPAASLLDGAPEETHYNLHVGTFPADSTYSFSFDLVNTGRTNATLIGLTLSGATPDIDAFELITELGTLPKRSTRKQYQLLRRTQIKI